MCKFHKELATEIATDKLTGNFSPLHYSVAVAALARYWIDQYMPEMGDCDGNLSYQMTTPQAIDALARSGLSKDLPGIARYRKNNMDALRNAVDGVIVEQNLTLSALNLPLDPVRDSRFLDELMVEIYEGDPLKGQTVRNSVTRAQAEPMRRAVAALYAQPGVEQILKTMIEGNFARLFIEARTQVRPTLQKAFNALPTRLQNAFHACSSCATGAAGGAITGHIGCILPPVLVAGGLAPVTGGSLAMLSIGAGLTAAMAGLWYWRGGRYAPSLQKKIVLGGYATGLALAVGFHMASGGHDHGNHNHHHDEHAQMLENAKALKMSLAEYEALICKTPRP